MRERDEYYDQMKNLADELIDLSQKNGLACLISFETKIPNTCYTTFVGTTERLGYIVNFMERSLESKTHYSMRAIKEKGYQYGFYQQKNLASAENTN